MPPAVVVILMKIHRVELLFQNIQNFIVAIEIAKVLKQMKLNDYLIDVI